MKHIKEALKRGKRVYLVNTVWQTNPYHYDDLLPKLSAIVTREVLSQRELRDNHSVESSVALDFSYFCPITEKIDARDYRGKIVVTDFWSRASKTFVEHPTLSNEFDDIDMRAIGWSELIAGLRTASLLVTGRHHGVYAALRARVPFVAMVGNCHKIEGLIATSKIPIPLIRSFDELPSAIKQAPLNEPIYRELFDWAAAQPKWTAASLGE